MHGFWGGASHWQSVVNELVKAGIDKIKALELPLSSLEDDAKVLSSVIANTAGEVVLVGHSYGGAVITQAGDAKNVAALVYIAGFAPSSNESAGGLSEEIPSKGILDGIIAPDELGQLWIKQDKYAKYFCADVPSEQAFFMSISQKAPKASTFSDTISSPAWAKKPSFYQISSQDLMISPELQQKMADKIGAKEILTLQASHASLASKPKEIAEFIIKACKIFK